MRVWNLGYSRVGRKRELKRELERYWAGKIDVEELLAGGRSLCSSRWIRQHELGVESIPLNDFSFFDLLRTVSPHRFLQFPQNHLVGLNSHPVARIPTQVLIREKQNLFTSLKRPFKRGGRI